MSTAHELTLPAGLPGFPTLTKAALTPVADVDLPEVYAELADTASPIRFLMARPHPFFPDYAFTVDDATTALLGDDADQVDVWVLLTHTDAEGITANLRAPLLVNRATGVAAQAVLPDTHSLRAPLL